MKKFSKALAFTVVVMLILTVFAGCAGEQVWSNKNVVFSYDENGDPVITFPDNFDYPEAIIIKNNEPLSDSHSPVEITLTEHLQQLKKLDKIGSLYLIKILRRLSIEEKRNLPSYSNLAGSYEISIIYEVAVIYDYFNNEEINQVHLFCQGTFSGEEQIYGYPTYKNGDILVVLTNKLSAVSVGRFLGPFFVDNKTIDFNSEVFLNHKSIPEMDSIALEMNESERYRLSEYEKNPRRFNQKFKLGELIKFVKAFVEDC